MNMPSNTQLINPRRTWGEKVRLRIDSGAIVQRLQQVALGLEEATQTEINAARILLDRTLPAIKPIEVATGDGGNAKDITNDQLFSLIEGESKRIE
jgi:hypothetical protein